MILFLCFLLFLTVFKFVEHFLHPHGYESSPLKIYEQLQRIIEGKSPYAWDDLGAKKLKDPRLEAIRQRVLKLEWDFPPESKKELLSSNGYEALRAIARELEREIIPPSAG